MGDQKDSYFKAAGPGNALVELNQKPRQTGRSGYFHCISANNTTGRLASRHALAKGLPGMVRVAGVRNQGKRV